MQKDTGKKKLLISPSGQEESPFYLNQRAIFFGLDRVTRRKKKKRSDPAWEREKGGTNLFRDKERKGSDSKKEKVRGWRFV